ncbi:MAG: NAD(P)H-dependent oxidoreductase [Bacteroidales bacterium]|nr:NAD(P)H-dependent oxidoreductase [Bacteroidales bacterium]
MKQIALISSSIRIQRNSHFVALYFKSYIEENNIASVYLLDLNEYKFPLFDERMRFQKDPSEKVLDFAARIKNADGIIIVTPEYNGGYPASLKNVVDLLHKEWYHKPVAISTVSDGNFGGSQVIISLQFVLWKIKAWTVPAMFPVPDVNEVFDAHGVPVDKETLDKRAAPFIKELLWCIEANRRMNEPL